MKQIVYYNNLKSTIKPTQYSFYPKNTQYITKKAIVFDKQKQKYFLFILYLTISTSLTVSLSLSQFSLFLGNP